MEVLFKDQPGNHITDLNQCRICISLCVELIITLSQSTKYRLIHYKEKKKEKKKKYIYIYIYIYMYVQYLTEVSTSLTFL